MPAAAGGLILSREPVHACPEPPLLEGCVLR
jgi:hypothetical protein